MSFEEHKLIQVRYDPSRFILEHYVDGDQCNEAQETIISESSHDNLYVWGEYSWSV
jgi:hypothetical protein